MEPQLQGQNGILGLLQEMKGKMSSIGPKIRSFLDQRRASSEKMKSMLNEVNTILDGLDFKEIKQNRDKVAQLTKQLEEANKRIEQLDSENANLRESLNAAENKIAQLQNEINRLNEEHRIQIERLNQEHAEEIKRLNEEHAAAINDLNQQIQTLQQELAELKVQLVNLTNERDQIEASVRELNDLLNEQLDLIEGYLREIEMDAENENLLTTILTKLNAIRMELNKPSNPNMPPPPPPSQNIRVDSNGRSNTESNFITQMQQIIQDPRLRPKMNSIMSKLRQINLNNLFTNNRQQLSQLFRNLKDEDYNYIMKIVNQMDGGRRSRKYKKRSKRHYKRRSLKGGWVYKADPRLDSESSVITEKSSSSSSTSTKGSKRKSVRRLKAYNKNKSQSKKRSKM